MTGRPREWDESGRVCARCSTKKPLSEFHVRRQRNNQPRSTCKECNKAATRRWFKTDRARAFRAEYQRERRKSDPAYKAAQRAIVDANNARRRGARHVGERFSRDEIYERDNGRCHLCGKRVSRSDWDLDHVIPLARGGAHTRDNVAVSHPACNGSKHAQLTHLF